MNSINIRPITSDDDVAIASLIRKVLLDIGVPKVGTAYADPILDVLHSVYQSKRSQYYLLEVENKLMGGAGIAPLEGEEEGICELQKMYFLPEARGKGWGQQMMDKCLAFAKEQKYHAVYIETLPTMQAAQKLYLKNGFQYIDFRLGNTGHFSCNIWMLKKL